MPRACVQLQNDEQLSREGPQPRVERENREVRGEMMSHMESTAECFILKIGAQTSSNHVHAYKHDHVLSLVSASPCLVYPCVCIRLQVHYLINLYPNAHSLANALSWLELHMYAAHDNSSSDF